MGSLALGAAEVPSADSHWAFQPVVRPAIPAAKISAGAANPVDAFIQARLSESGLTPSSEADRGTLIRRLYLVMLGVPPTPEEVSAFLADLQPRAWERWLDRVLEDPRYGERWGRHWLDVIRFAESNGFETNRERLSAWRFRDYVIDAFNTDKPYDRFIREQIAGDALGVDVATGFLVGGPVDIVKSPDITLTAQQRADEIDDMLGTTGTSFLGLTLGCARCHTHKFDPITHTEYYSMAAIFSGVQHGERPLPSSPEQAASLAQIEDRIRDLEKRLDVFIPKAVPSSPTARKVLRPAVNSVRNEDRFAETEARFLRFTILASSGGEPCIDELEVGSGNVNLALASAGTKATASGSLAGYEIHKLEHLNDGRPGNARSWISSEAGKGWVQLEFPKAVRIDRVVWGRDREGNFKDRLTTQYRIELATQPGVWKTVASSEDRTPFPGESTKPAGPEYRFDGIADSEAAQGRRWLAELESARKQKGELAKSPTVYSGTFSQPG
ncbi:MAG: DUF1549 domain-containing protein, partial [Limisphaerales bacterium]